MSQDKVNQRDVAVEAGIALLESIKAASERYTHPEQIDALARAYAAVWGALPKGDGKSRGMFVG